MLKRILLAVDGSEGALDAARLLAALPLTAGTEIEVVCVIDPYIERLLESVREGIGHHAQRVVRAAVEIVEREGLQVRGTERKGTADQEILRAARELRADLIVLGSHGLTGIEGFLLGSVASNVAKHASCSVLIGRALHHQLADVVVGTDGSAHGDWALELAATLPLPASTTCAVTHVVRSRSTLLALLAIEVERLWEQLHDAEQADRVRAAALVAAGRNLLLSRGKRVDAVVRTGDPASEILAVIEDRMADLVIVGARGVSRIEGLLTGSVADRLLAKAECSVLVARPALGAEEMR